MTSNSKLRFQFSLTTLLVGIIAFTVGFFARSMIDEHHPKDIGATVPASTDPVKVGEVLEIECDVNKNLERRVVVLSDEVIEMPIIGAFDVQGQSPNQIEKLLNRRFAKLGASNVRIRVFRATSNFAN